MIMELFWKKEDIMEGMFILTKTFFPSKKWYIYSSAPNMF